MKKKMNESEKFIIRLDNVITISSNDFTRINYFSLYVTQIGFTFNGLAMTQIIIHFFSLLSLKPLAVTLQFVSHSFLDYHDPTIGKVIFFFRKMKNVIWF